MEYDYLVAFRHKKGINSEIVRVNSKINCIEKLQMVKERLEKEFRYKNLEILNFQMIGRVEK